MRGVVAVVTAELLQLQLLRHRLLVLRGRVVAPLALGALKRDDLSSCACHILLLRVIDVHSVEPSTRFELVTPSLPRTCSTPELRGLTSQRAEGRRQTCFCQPLLSSNQRLTLPRDERSRAASFLTFC